MLDNSPILDKKISPLIEGQVPDFIQAEHGLFVQFVKSYYKFLESAELKLSLNLDSLIGEENSVNYILMEKRTLSQDEDRGEKIILESGVGSTGKFVNGETVTGQTSKATAICHVEDTSNGRIFISANQKFIEGETIIGSITQSQATIISYTPNPVQNIQQLLEYSSPDNTLDALLDNFRKMFMSIIPSSVATGLSKRKLIKIIRELYTAKGTSEGHKFFLRLLLDEEASIVYPEKFMMRISGGDWNTPQTLRTTNGGFPADRDINEFVGQTATGITSGSTVVLVSGELKKFNTNNVDENFWEYEIDPNTINGTFVIGEQVRVVSKTNDYIYKFTLANRVVDVNIEDGGILYGNNDSVSSDDLFANAFNGFTVSSVGVGSVSDVVIDNAGTGYAEGDNLVFNSSGQPNTADAVAKVSVVSGMLRLEDGTASNSGTDGGQLLVESGEDVIIERTDISLETGTTGFDSSSPYNRIILENSEGVGSSADSLIYENELDTISMPQVPTTYKDGIVLEPDTTNGDSDHKGIRKIHFINGGAGYSGIPSVSVTSTGGSGTKIIANTNNIGSIKDIGISLSTGIANDSTGKQIFPRVHAIVKNITGSIIANNTITIGGEGTIKNFDPVRQIVSIQPTVSPNSSITMETGSDLLLEDGGSIMLDNCYHKGQTGTITTSNGAIAEIININPASAKGVLGMFSNKLGAYPIDKLSTLGEAKVRIQDSRYYQQFSYEVQVGAGLSQYINELRKAVHPSGFNVFGKVTIASTVAAGINVITGKDAPGYTGDETFTPELASLFTRVFDRILVSRRLGTADDGTSINSQPSKVNSLGVDDIFTDNNIGFKANKRDLTLSNSTKVKLGLVAPNFPNNNALQILNKFPFLTRSGRVDLETQTHEEAAATTFDSTTTTFDNTGVSFDVGPGFARGVLSIDAIPSNLSATVVNLAGSSTSIGQSFSSQNDAILLEDGSDTSSGAVLSQIGSIVFTDIFQYHTLKVENNIESIILEDGDDIILEDGLQLTERLDFPPSVYTDAREKAITYPSVINIS